NGDVGTLLLDPINITIANGTGDSAFAGQILAGDTAPTTTIYESELEGLAGDTNVVLQATNDITIEDLADDALDFQSGDGSITLTADADSNGVGSVLMEDTLDTIYSNGRDIAISGASLTLGDIDTSFISSIGSDEPKQEVAVNVNAGGPIPATGTSGTATFLFSVSNLEGVINDLDVVFSAEHTYDSDLTVSLSSPQNTSLNLFSGVGDDGENFQDTRLDDRAETSINQATAPFNEFSSYRPTGSLAIFDGETPNGNWTLTVTDNAELDSGRLFKAGETAPWGTANGTQLLFQLVTNPPVNPVDPNSGSVTLNATNGNISAGQLNTANNNLGTGGEITLDATGDITTADVNSFASSGNGGAITLEAGGNISAELMDSSSSLGNGGRINLNASGNLSVNDIGSFSEEGNGGAITLDAGENLSVNDIYSFSEEGNGGAINLNAKTVNIEDALIYAVSFNGQGGNVTITATATDSQIPGIQLVDTLIAVTRNSKQADHAQHSANGGNITLTANDSSIRLNNAQIITESGSEFDGEAGNISISANSLYMKNESLISAQATGNANGGNITINTPLLVVLPPTGPDGSDIIARAEGGNGGKINITARGIIGINRRSSGVIGIEQRRAEPNNKTNDIDASSDLGVSGEVEINQAIDPSRGITELPEERVDASGQIINRCTTQGRGNEFSVTARQGFPASSDQPLTGNNALADLGSLVEGDGETGRRGAGRAGGDEQLTIDNSPKQIVEAQGWVKLADGTVVLSAESSTVKSSLPGQSMTNCQGS
ncbi:MAG: proprotein convertase P-domain-containing protein, partial [Coleofasciculaceae cyanobacterium]